jgi:PAS domain S-box-containing protein
METLFGYSMADTEVGNATFWVDRIHPEDKPRLLHTLQEIFDQTVQNIWQEEYRFLKAGGTYAYVYDKAYIIRDEMNKPLRMIGTMQDITHQKETELLLKDLNEKTKQRARDLQESNSELERFAYVASHDLQEPLRMVSSFLQLLDKRLKENNMIDEKSEQYMSFAVDGANRMKRLILDLLEYSRVNTSTDALGNTNMNEVVLDVKDIFRAQITETNATITASVLPVLPNTRRTQMVQLLQNLVGNALKYNTSTTPTIHIDVKEDDHRWIFSVQDNGIGFDPKFAEEIFTIFQRLHTRSEYAGTGIGLSICKKIVERHGGKIWAESTPGSGSTFYFSIPKSTS